MNGTESDTTLQGELAEAEALIGMQDFGAGLAALGRARQAALVEQDVESLRKVLRLVETAEARAIRRATRREATELVEAIERDLGLPGQEEPALADSRVRTSRLSRVAIIIAAVYCGVWLILGTLVPNHFIFLFASLGLALPFLIALAAPRLGGALLIVGGIIAGGSLGTLGIPNHASWGGAVAAIVFGILVGGAPAIGPGISFFRTGTQRKRSGG